MEVATNQISIPVVQAMVVTTTSLNTARIQDSSIKEAVKPDRWARIYINKDDLLMVNINE